MESPQSGLLLRDHFLKSATRNANGWFRGFFLYLQRRVDAGLHDCKTTEQGVHTEWQRSFSGVHFIMMEKSAQAGDGRGGGARPPPVITFTITYKVAVYAPAAWADTLTQYHLYHYMYSVLPSTYKSTDYPLPPLLNVMYCVRVPLRTVKRFLEQL